MHSVRVSNELGKGNAKAAKFSIKVILGVSICIGVIFFALCLAFGKQISYIFTSNEEIAEEVSSLSTLLAFSILLNSVQPVLSGNSIIHLPTQQIFNQKKKKSQTSCFDQRLTSRFLSSGVAIGAGFQGTVAFINIGSYYVFGVPLALLLGYVADLQVKVRTHYSTFTDYQIITLVIILLPSDLVSERS
jgi:MATE family multidrug resistance protein